MSDARAIAENMVGDVDALTALVELTQLPVTAERPLLRRKRPPSERAIRHAWLTDLVTKANVDSRGTYGARRVHAELTIGMGIIVGHNAVEMLMRRAGLQGLPDRPQDPAEDPF